MHRKFGNLWLEYRDSIDLINLSSNMESGLCWYKKESTISGLKILWIIGR